MPEVKVAKEDSDAMSWVGLDCFARVWYDLSLIDPIWEPGFLL